MLEHEAAVIMSPSASSPAKDPVVAKSRSDAMFEQADTNGDGVLTREVQPALSCTHMLNQCLSRSL